jgi:hypothetical protein
MRNVTRSYIITDAPAILQQAATIAASTTIALAGNAEGINQRTYSDPYVGDPDEGHQSRVIDKLNQWYYGKCAYCERFYKLDVEHFRPKGEVRDENNVLLRATGYYWLGYEWSNLLPSCISCNREGGKNSKFPYVVGGNIVTTPIFDQAGILDRSFCIINHHTLIAELPALLNPETDLNIETYFGFEIDSKKEGIKIRGVDLLNRGKITTIICKLNRPELRRDRLQDVVMEFVNSVHNAIAILKVVNDNNLFADQLNLLIRKLYSDCDEPKLSHTLLRRYIVASSQNFNDIIIPFVVPQFQQILLSAFINYVPI